MFIDRTKLSVKAGDGGNGIVAWRREKYIPKGGPAGGNGGKGGSVIFVADVQIPSLEWYRNRAILKAENGKQGGPNKQQGRNGNDLILKVPCGTLVKDANTGEILHDFTKDQERWVICKGGKGGRGNDSFKSPTNRAPNTYTEGGEGESAEIELELKLIADVGLVGFPNAGKSTLISALAKVKAKIAPYPFTTLHPNIGFIETKDYRRIFIADIPGIIEGAHLNRGLGFEFLRHIERTRLLIFMLDASGIDNRDPVSDFQVLKNELKSYSEELVHRPHFVVLNKIDADEAKEYIKAFKQAFPSIKNLFQISALQGEGIPELLQAIEIFFFPQEIDPWLT